MDDEKRYLGVLRKAIIEELDSIRFFVENIDRLNYSENKRLVDRLTLDTLEHAQTLIRLLHLTYRPERSELKPAIHKKARGKILALQKVYHKGQGKAHPKVQKRMKDLFEEKERHEQMVLMMR